MGTDHSQNGGIGAQQGNGSGPEGWMAPRDDINAPDLYIPSKPVCLSSSSPFSFSPCLDRSDAIHTKDNKMRKKRKKEKEKKQKLTFPPPHFFFLIFPSFSITQLHQPAMALVTYTLLSALASGLQSRFHPEVLGVSLSTALGVVLLEFLGIK